MNFTEFCIRRPVFSSVITLVIILLGSVCRSRLPIMLEPKVEIPVITVESNYPGAGPDVVESQVTKHLEGVFGTIQGLDFMKSVSSTGSSKIQLNFLPGRSLDAISSDVRDKLSQIQEKLPRDMAIPTISKSSTDDAPIMTLVFNSEKLGNDQVRDHIDKFIKNRFEVINGVATVDVSGGSEIAMNIFLDPQKLAAYSLTPIEVNQAIAYQSLQRPGGVLSGDDREFALNVTGELLNEKQFDDIIIANQNGKHIYLKDVGVAKLSPKERRSTFLFDGKESVALAISKQSVANPLDVAKGVKKILPEIRRFLPAAIDFKIARDDTVYIEKSINTVYRTIVEATVLVTIVVFLFLWSLRGIIVPLVTIPVSLLGAFIFLYACGFSINNVTLLALVLAIGLVVDDAIVILENIHRYIEKGLDSIEAAIKGTKEITFTIIAMTITLAAVYAPIGLTPGQIGKTFTEFALALASAVILSGIVALTLSPMMCSKLLVREKSSSGKKHKEFLEKIDRVYEKLLTYAMDSRKIVIGAGLIVSLTGVLLTAYKLPSEDYPNEDYGYVPFSAYGPTSSSFAYMLKYAKQIDKILDTIPEAQYRYIKVDSSRITGFINLIDWMERTRKPKDISDELRQGFSNIIGVIPLSSSGESHGSGGLSVKFVLQTAVGIEYLQRQAIFFSYYLRKYGGDMFTSIESTPTSNAQEYAVRINRERASSLGVQVMDIADTIEILFRGRIPTRIKHKGNRYDVFLTMEESLKKNLEYLDNIYIKGKIRNNKNNDEEKMVALRDVIDIEKRQAPVTLTHYNQLLAWDFSIGIKDGVGLDEAIAKIQQIKADNLSSDIMLEFASSTKSYLENRQVMFFIFFMAISFIFLVLAAQFESFIDPLIILFSVPLSMSGAIIVLSMIPGGTLNIYSKIGLVTLIGLITKHGIMIVDFANHIQENEGKNKIEAVKAAALLRLRPILMTTFAMVFGTLPLALATGASAESRRQIGYVIVGGMSLGTLFTLFFIPVIYCLLSRDKRVQQQKIAK